MRKAARIGVQSTNLVPLAGGGAVRVRRIGQLPELAPARELREAPTLEQVFRFTQGSAHDESTDFRRRSETRDPFAFLTVYAINAAVMLFAFPVGFALLVFNILGGENLRTTAHVMGLTGLATALPCLGYNVPFLS